MKSRIKKLLPKSLIEWRYVRDLRVRSRREFRSDQARYLKFASPADRIFSGPMTLSHIETQVNKDYHRVEKALALAAPKRPFGDELGRRLDALIPRLPGDSALVDAAESARAALSRWNTDGVVDDEVSPVGGQPPSISEESLANLFLSRHSIRHFDAHLEVTDEILTAATELAGRSPSVCNRQSWRVRFAKGESAKARLLKYQSGNRGFGSVPVVALITADVRRFSGPNERNQAWIDAGIFSMSLILALHGMGVASCMLNMSVSNKTATALRREFGIPDYELIVMQIAIGYPAAGHRIARSPRRSMSETLAFID